MSGGWFTVVQVRWCVSAVDIAALQRTHQCLWLSAVSLDQTEWTGQVFVGRAAWVGFSKSMFDTEQPPFRHVDGPLSLAQRNWGRAAASRSGGTATVVVTGNTTGHNPITQRQRRSWKMLSYQAYQRQLLLSQWHRHIEEAWIKL